MKGIILGAVLLLPGAVNAQFPQLVPPNETDLHASYCSEVIEKVDVRWQEKALASLSAVPPPPFATDELIASMRGYLDASRAALRRLGRYIATRLLANLDVVGLAIAQAAATDDINRMDSAISLCSPCTGTDCMTECVARKMPDTEVIKKKFQACRDLSWLPF